jgi:hypothetical protein
MATIILVLIFLWQNVIVDKMFHGKYFGHKVFFSGNILIRNIIFDAIYFFFKNSCFTNSQYYIRMIGYFFNVMTLIKLGLKPLGKHFNQGSL